MVPQSGFYYVIQNEEKRSPSSQFSKKKKKTFPLSFYFVNAAETKEIDLVFLAPTKSTLGNQPKIIQEYPYKNKEKSHKVNDFKPR